MFTQYDRLVVFFSFGQDMDVNLLIVAAAEIEGLGSNIPLPKYIKNFNTNT